MIDNYKVIYKNLSTKVKGFIMYLGEDDYYTIILNSRMSYDSNVKTLHHELMNIKNNDFIKYKNVGVIENNVSKII